MQVPEILKFKELLVDIVPTNKHISNVKIRPLTAAGENYGSLILAIDITLQDEGPRKEVLHTVAKLLPSSQFMQIFMNINYSVRNELAFYQTILPTLIHFQQEQKSSKKLDFFPKFYTGRLTLDPAKNIVDENSIILLENLKVAGYGLSNRQEGFDLEATKLILTKMSDLHGAVIALKETQPKEFADNILPYFAEFPIFQMNDSDNDGFMTSEVVINAITEIVEKDEFCSPHIDKIRQTIKTCAANLALPKNAQKFRQDVFASLIHDDLWVNNVMIKTQDNKVVDLKILDWQLYEYASVVKDILFFLCSSAREDIFMGHLDSLITFYYTSLIANLKELNCSIEKFTFDVFQEELKRVANEVAYFYVMIALPSIFATDEHVWEIHELNKERMLGQVQASEVCKKRICFITKKFLQEGWI